MLLPALYHWSPAERRRGIQANGLQPYSPATVSTHEQNLGWPYVCLSPTPSGAWGLSGDMGWTSEIEEWDLWQVRLNEHDEVHVRSEWGNHIREIRVRNTITPDRCWWVATRTPPVAEAAA